MAAAEETFDITCWSGVHIYHTLRTQGHVGPGALSSTHIRVTDFEMAASDIDTKESFKAKTRALFLPCECILPYNTP